MFDDFGDCIQNLFYTAPPPYQVWEVLPSCTTQILFFKASLRFFWLFDRFTKHHVIGLMYSILDRDFFFVFLILFWIFGFKDIYCIAAWIEIHHILPKKYFDNYNFNAILGRHFWSNAGEICQDILFFCFLNSMTRLVPNMLKSLFFWKMIESTGLPLTSFDKTDKLGYFIFLLIVVC